MDRGERRREGREGEEGGGERGGGAVVTLNLPTLASTPREMQRGGMDILRNALIILADGSFHFSLDAWFGTMVLFRSSSG